MRKEKKSRTEEEKNRRADNDKRRREDEKKRGGAGNKQRKRELRLGKPCVFKGIVATDKISRRLLNPAKFRETKHFQRHRGPREAHEEAFESSLVSGN